MDGPVLREMSEDDVQAVAELEASSFSTPYPEEFFFQQTCRKYSVSLVAVLDGGVAGYIVGEFLSHEARILTLCVRPEYRRMGVGSLLINRAREELKKKGCVFIALKARASNDAARRFYESVGLKVSGVRKKYYEDPLEDALEMSGRV
jgi:[ribosomal protein S18]-alanine N-acetyltransferase